MNMNMNMNMNTSPRLVARVGAFPIATSSAGTGVCNLTNPSTSLRINAPAAHTRGGRVCDACVEQPQRLQPCVCSSSGTVPAKRHNAPDPARRVDLARGEQAGRPLGRAGVEAALQFASARAPTPRASAGVSPPERRRAVQKRCGHRSVWSEQKKEGGTHEELVMSRGESQRARGVSSRRDHDEVSITF